MTWVAVGVAAVSMVSGAQQAESVRRNGQITKEVADMNAKYAELDSFNAEAKGYTEEARYANVVDATISAQKVAMASEGVDTSFGTAGEIQKETKLTGFLNTLDIRNQAHAQAMGYKTEASNLRLNGITGQNTANTNAAAIQNASTMNAISTMGPSVSGYARGGAKVPKAVGT